MAGVLFYDVQSHRGGDVGGHVPWRVLENGEAPAQKPLEET